jgi:hypothetical protein
MADIAKISISREYGWVCSFLIGTVQSFLFLILSCDSEYDCALCGVY